MRTRQTVVLGDLLDTPTAEPEAVAHTQEDVVAAHERLAARHAEQEQQTRQKRRAVVMEATEVIDELHRIVEHVVDDHEEVSPLTERLVREVAQRSLKRAGENVETHQLSIESEMSPKERLLLSMQSLNEVKEKLSAEAESLSESVPEPQTPPTENA